MSYRNDFTEMLKGEYIPYKLFYNLNDPYIKDDIQFLINKLEYYSNHEKNEINAILFTMTKLQFFKIALTAKVSSSITINEENTKYISARAAVTIKSKDSKMAKRIWVSHYLGPLNDYLLPKEEIDLPKVIYFGRGSLVRKLVDKLMIESEQ